MGLCVSSIVNRLIVVFESYPYELRAQTLTTPCVPNL